MKVKDAIKQLKELDKDEEIIIAWWQKYDFDVSQKDWEESVPFVDSDFDWSSTHDDMTNYMKSLKD